MTQNWLLDVTPKAQEMKEKKTGKQDIMKILKVPDLKDHPLAK